jgi:hypothetical protein
MGIKKSYQREMHDAGRLDKIQALTQASTGTRVKNFGVTSITSAGSGTAATHGFIMDNPTGGGLRKTLVVDPNSTREVAVYNASTAVTFFGSTGNALVFSTGAGTKQVELVSLSATQWAFTARSTGVTVSATTIGA